MSSYYAPESWYDIDCDTKAECEFCTDAEDKKQEASEFMKDLVKQLYSQNPIDKYKLENCLDELCHYFNIKLNPNDLHIQKTKEVLAYV